MQQEVQRLEEQYKVGLIGTGYWGSKILAELEKHPKVGEIRSTGNDKIEVDSIMCDQDVSHIFIATPVHTHFALCLSALDCGKHVMCEKNFVTSAEDARVLVDFAKDCELTLLVDYIYTFNPELEKIQMDDTKQLHIIFSQHGAFRDEGVMSMLGSHALAVAGTVVDLEGAQLLSKTMTYARPPYEGFADCIWTLPDKTVVCIRVRNTAEEGAEKVRHLSMGRCDRGPELNLDYPNGIRMMIDRFFSGRGNGRLAIQVAKCLDQLNHRW